MNIILDQEEKSFMIFFSRTNKIVFTILGFGQVAIEIALNNWRRYILRDITEICCS
jgi:hypothetical protein